MARGVPTDGQWAESLTREDSKKYCGDDLSVYNVTYEDVRLPAFSGERDSNEYVVPRALAYRPL